MTTSADSSTASLPGPGETAPRPGPPSPSSVLASVRAAVTAALADRVARRVIPIMVAGYALGVALVVIAYRQAEHDTGFDHFAVFWVGLAVVLAVTVLGGVEARTNTRLLSWLLVAFGLFTYLPKFLMSVNGPAYFDEYGHYRHVIDMIADGNIHANNAILPVVQYYPGLGVVTALVHYVTWLNLWHSGQVVIVAAHCATLLLIFALARAVELSRGASFAAAMIFAANPSFMYFDSQYAYESLAIPMLLAAGVCTARARLAGTAQIARRYGRLGLAAVVCTALTHHIASIVMVGLVVLIALFVPAAAEDGALRREQKRYAWLVAGFGLAMVAVWTLAVSTRTRSYLLPTLTSGFDQLLARFTGASGNGRGEAGSAAETGNHSPFSGTTVPSYEHVLAFVAPPLVLLVLIIGLWRILRSPDRRRELRRAAPFWIFTGAYLASLPLALTAGGNEAAHRAWPYFYIGVAVLAVWGFGRPEVGNGRLLARLGTGSTGAMVATTALLLCLNIGNITAGTNITYRFPGPFEFGSDNRFETPELDGLVSWANANLPAGAGVVTDRFTMQALMIGTKLEFPTSTQADAYYLFDDPENPPQWLQAFLHRHGFTYFVLDRRIVHQTPATAFYQIFDRVTPSMRRNLASIPNGLYIQLLHTTPHYSVYKINS